MPLTVANLTVVDNTALTQYSVEGSSTGRLSLLINEPGKLIEVHQLLFSANIGSNQIRLGQYSNTNYLILRFRATLAIFANFSNAPFVFPGVGEHLFIDGMGTANQMAISLWYRLIDSP